ncbi:hypothetical protein ACVOMS_25555 [Bradyrhizobium guangxiense]
MADEVEPTFVPTLLELRSRFLQEIRAHKSNPFKNRLVSLRSALADFRNQTEHS